MSDMFATKSFMCLPRDVQVEYCMDRPYMRLLRMLHRCEERNVVTNKAHQKSWICLTEQPGYSFRA
jgi:hypothetical protein